MPPEAVLWAVMRESEEKALKPTAELIRDRQAHYARLAQEAE